MGERKLHILFATIDFVENNGPTTGMPKYIYRTAKILVSWGHEVTVVTCSNRTVEYDFFGIHVHRVRRVPYKKVGNLYEDEIIARKRDSLIIHNEIEKIIKRSKVDIIQYASPYGIAYYHDFLVPAIMRMSMYSKMWPVIGGDAIKDARSYMEKKAAERCNGIIAPSCLIAKVFGDDICREVRVIETPRFLENSDENESIYRNYLKGKEYILFYGTITGHKGMQLIADSIFNILDRYKDCYYVLVGAGDIRWISTIKANAKEYADRVIYLSALGFSELVPIIKGAELITLPSQMENLSNACIESMALGQIVLGTRGASFEQLIEHKKNGVLCEIDDSKTFIEGIEFVFGLNCRQRNNICTAAKETVDRLSPEKVTKELLTYYREIIDKYAAR